MRGSRYALIGAALAAATLPVQTFADDDAPNLKPLNLNPARLKRADPDALAAMVAARQRIFGPENVDPKNGKVDKNKVIVSWFSVAVVRRRCQGAGVPARLVHLSHRRHAPAMCRLLLQDLVDLDPEAIFLGHGHGDHADNAAYIVEAHGRDDLSARRSIAPRCAVDAGRHVRRGQHR